MDDASLAAERRPVIEEHHGIAVAEDYRHLEHAGDPAVQAWAKAQAIHAATILATIPGRRQLGQRIDELADAMPLTIREVVRQADGGLFYCRQVAGDDVAAICFRNGPTGPERVLVDPATLPRPAGGHAAVMFFQPSPDGTKLLYGSSVAGSEETTLRILDVETGASLPLEIDRIESVYAPPSWLPSGGGFLYSRRRPPADRSVPSDTYRFTQAFLQELGDDGGATTFVFGAGSPGSPAFEPMDFPSVVVPPGSSWAIGQVNHGDEENLSLWALPSCDLGSPHARWRRICDRDGQVTAYSVHGDDIFLLTARGAPRYQVVRTSLEAPDLQQAAVMVPPGEAVLTSLAAAADALYVGTLRVAHSAVLRVPFDRPGDTAPIRMPAGAASATIVAVSPLLQGALLQGDSWTYPGRIFCFTPGADAVVDTGLQPIAAFAGLAEITATEVIVRSHDGVGVPLSIIHRGDLPRDGSRPAIISGYGAYGAVTTARFDATSLAWLERGGLLAVAHVRGGGTFGKGWHDGGRKITKPNTWKDLIACAEYLVDQGYTAPKQLAVRGRSGGGILAGRAITERADLFAAAEIAVGCTDMVRFELTENGPPNVPEFGSLAVPEEFRALLTMSTLHQIVDGEPYPAVLLTHGINDRRVEPWQSFKTAARLQAATSSGRPVLLRLDYQAGHGIGSTRSQRHAELADVWAFMLWQMGHGDFQPPAADAAGSDPVEQAQFRSQQGRESRRTTAGAVP